MRLSLIYARAENRCIGKGGGLPWHLPDESRFFEKTTHGNAVIMGRKTYEDHRCVLPGRLNIVVTRTPEYAVERRILVVTSLGDALGAVAERGANAFVIGGVRLFVEAMPGAHRVYETVVHATVDGDTYLPDFDFEAWQTTLLGRHAADPLHDHAFSTFLHERKVAASG